MPIPKKWSEVEKTSEYQGLSDRDKFLAKKAYWDEISIPAIQQYNTKNIDSPVKIEDVKKDFFGGILREDIPEISSSDAALQFIGDYYAGNIKVLAGSAGRLVSGLAQPILHPVETVKGLGGLLRGTFEKILPGEQPNEVYFDNLAQIYKDRYGSEDAIAETVSQDPFGFVADVYMIAGATSAAGKLSSIKKIQEATSLAKTGQALTTGMKSLKKAIPIKSTSDKVFNAYNKAFLPRGKTIKRTLGIKDDVVDAIKAIDENIPEEGLVNPLTGAEIVGKPKTRFDVLVALDHAKKRIWEKANSLSKNATEANAKINIKNVASKALEKTKNDWGDVAVKTTKADDVVRIKSMVDKFDELGNVSPTQVEGFLKSLYNDTKTLRESGQYQGFTLKDFYSNMYDELRGVTDDVISKTLDKSGYKHYRTQYAKLKGIEKQVQTGANKFVREQAKRGGITHPLVNLWSVEELLSGNLLKAGTVKGASMIVDFFTNPDKKVQSMFKNVSKIKGVEPVQVLNPNLLKQLKKDLPKSVMSFM